MLSTLAILEYKLQIAQHDQPIKSLRWVNIPSAPGKSLPKKLVLYIKLISASTRLPSRNGFLGQDTQVSLRKRQNGPESNESQILGHAVTTTYRDSFFA